MKTAKVRSDLNESIEKKRIVRKLHGDERAVVDQAGDFRKSTHLMATHGSEISLIDPTKNNKKGECGVCHKEYLQRQMTKKEKEAVLTAKKEWKY
jgi:hypothetical protein